MAEVKLGNPAVVGLAGFGLTTFVLQLHNLGLCGLGPVLWLGLVFGGTAQLIAGLMEMKTGNNFGFCAFTGYGAFWIALCFYLIFGTNAEFTAAWPIFKLTKTDLGVFLVAYTIFTFILLIASMKHHFMLFFTFFTLILGFIGLDLRDLTGNEAAGTFASYILLVTAFSALYIMAHVIFAEAGIHLPVGSPVWKSKS